MAKKKKVESQDVQWLKEKLAVVSLTISRLEQSLLYIEERREAAPFGNVSYDYWAKIHKNNRLVLENEYALLGWISTRIEVLEKEND